MRLAGTLCGIALALVAGGASAQNIPVPNAEAREAAQAFGTCVIERSGTSWLRLLGKPFGGPASTSGMQRFMTADSECLRLPATLRFPPVLVRGVLFEALYAEEFGKSPPVESFEGVPSPGYPVDEKAYENLAIQYRASMRFGECVVRQSPAAARAMILTKVETPEEKAAIQPLMHALQMCVIEGETVVLDKSVVRGAIAEPLYRLSKARAG